MAKLIHNCPACNGKMYIASLQCPDCGMELRNKFEVEHTNALNSDQQAFLLTFLKHRGNLKNLQTEMQISYPTAKKKLDELLCAMGLQEQEPDETEAPEVIDVNNWNTNKNSHLASEIIKSKLKEAGGRVIVHTLQNLPCEICAAPDGVSFISDKLPIKPPYTYDVFDVIVEFLQENNCRAKKGNGRNCRLGHGACGLDTVIGAVSARYSGKKVGESVFDPIFVLAAVLEWAGIAHNERGELILTQEYRNRL